MFKRVRCPIDNGKMTKMTCLSGPNAGRKFYVCEHYRDGDPRFVGHKIPIEKHYKHHRSVRFPRWRLKKILRRGIPTIILLALIVSVVLAFTGVSPFSNAKDKLFSYFHIGQSCKSDPNNPIDTNTINYYGSWKFDLLCYKWDKNILIVNFKMTNLGGRVTVGGYPFLDSNIIEIIAIDSTGKQVSAECKQRSITNEQDWIDTFNGKQLYTYQKEYYTGESWSGTLKFDMSSYSGKTGLYASYFSDGELKYIFDVGSPQ